MDWAQALARIPLARAERALDTLRALVRELEDRRRGTAPLFLVVEERDLNSAGQVGIAHANAPMPLRHAVMEEGWRKQAAPPRHLLFSYYREATRADLRFETQALAARLQSIRPGSPALVANADPPEQHSIMDVVRRLGGHVASIICGRPEPHQGKNPGAWAEALHDHVAPDDAWSAGCEGRGDAALGATLPLPHVVFFHDVAAASVQLAARLEQALQRRLNHVPFVTLEFLDDGDVIISGRRVRVSDGHRSVLRALARAWQLGDGSVALLPSGRSAAKSFRTRLSDMRSPKGKVSATLRAVLDSLPLPLFHPGEPRFNPDLDLDITFQ